MAAGGMDWFRWHHGSVNDPKFQLVARRVGCSVAEVIAVWACLLEAASQSEERGVHGVLDFESMDCSLGLSDGRSADIYLRMQERMLVDGVAVCRWQKRQPKRERDDDSSTERVRAYRARQSAETPQKQETGLSNDGIGVSNDETPCNAKKRLEESRGEKSNTTSSLRSDVAPRKRAPRTPTTAPLTRPDRVPESVWQDFQALRAAKRAPLTDTALRGIEREAEKVGLTLEQALAYCCEAGWQGFNAGWFRNRGSGVPVRGGGRANAQSFAASDREAGMQRWEKMTGQVHPDRKAAQGDVIDVDAAPAGGGQLLGVVS